MSPRLQHSRAQSKGCGHSGSHTCSTPHPQAGLAIATDHPCLPQDRHQGQGRPQQGRKLDEWSRGLARAGPQALGNRLLCVRGSLPPSFLGRGTHSSWLALLTCLWAVLHPPFASVAEAGDPLAPHRGNVQGRQPGPPDSLVSAGMRGALWHGSEGNSQGPAGCVRPRLHAPATPTLRLPTLYHKLGRPALPLSCHVGGHTHVHPCVTLVCV